MAEAEHPIEAPAGTLDAFYRALSQTAADQPGAVTRVIHYGDSMLTGDGITNAIRQRLQARFGDGGHGFVLAGRPWRWYHHEGVDGWNSSGFRTNRITANPTSDGLLGLGGVVQRTFRGGARFRVETVGDEQVSRFELFYLAHPRGGDVTLQIDDGDEVELSARADEPVSRVYSLTAPEEGNHRLTVTHGGGGEVHFFGVVLERDGPGVVWDSLGVNGLHASNFDRFDEEHLAEQVRLRAPALIAVMLGTNESQNPNLPMDRHGADYGEMLRLLRRGAPEASCLVISPPDRTFGASYRGRDLIGEIAARQREVALRAGCAFWNTYEAMGGRGSATRWRRHNPPLLGGDLTHPTPAGSERIGAWLAEALLAGYDQWRAGSEAPLDTGDRDG